MLGPRVTAKLIFAAVAIATVDSGAEAGQRYLFVDVLGDGSYGQFVDLNSIQKHGSKFDYWMLQVNLAATATKARYVSHALRRYTQDCAAGTSQMTYAALYLGTGEPLNRGPVDTAPEPIVPDTVGEEVQDLLCRGKMPSYAAVDSIDSARALARKMARKLPKH